MTPRLRKETSRFEPTPHRNIWRDRRSNILWFRGTVSTDDLQSKVVDRSLKTKSIGEALERAKRIRVTVAQGDQAEKKRRTFADAFELVLKMQSTKSKGTDDQARSLIENHLKPWFESHCPSLDHFVQNYESVWADYKLTAGARRPPAHIEDPDEREKWSASHTDPRKLGHDRRYLIMALTRAFRSGWIKKQFAKRDLELNEVWMKKGKYLADESLIALITAARSYPKLYLQVLLASHMGMRISECLHLRVEEIDFNRMEVNLDPRRLKIRRPREVPIPIIDEVAGPLKEAVAAAKGEFIFPAEHHSIEGRQVDLTRPQDDNRYHWQKVLAATGIKATFHDLRRTAITNLLAQGIPSYVVEKICGVEEDTMKECYAFVFREVQNRFRAAFTGKFIPVSQ